jgi:hypothetical protein
MLARESAANNFLSGFLELRFAGSYLPVATNSPAIRAL